jgi:hypothetical protein
LRSATTTESSGGESDRCLEVAARVLEKQDLRAILINESHISSLVADQLTGGDVRQRGTPGNHVLCHAEADGVGIEHNDSRKLRLGADDVRQAVTMEICQLKRANRVRGRVDVRLRERAVPVPEQDDHSRLVREGRRDVHVSVVVEVARDNAPRRPASGNHFGIAECSIRAAERHGDTCRYGCRTRYRGHDVVVAILVEVCDRDIARGSREWERGRRPEDRRDQPGGGQRAQAHD